MCSSVFNHYNRVQSNLAQVQEQEAVNEWSTRKVSDGTLVQTAVRAMTYALVDQLGVFPADVHPHPQRTHSLHFSPLGNKPSAPLFEKSNVLMMCVLDLYALDEF